MFQIEGQLRPLLLDKSGVGNGQVGDDRDVKRRREMVDSFSGHHNPRKFKKHKARRETR